MKRSDFFKSIFGAAAVAALPSQLQAVESEREYSFDEIFHQPYNNQDLFYPIPNTFIYNKIKELIGLDRILEGKYFTSYLGFNSNLLPIKGKYSTTDFLPFVLAANSYYQKNCSFAETEQGVFFRMFRESPDTMHFDVFLGNIRGQYHS